MPLVTAVSRRRRVRGRRWRLGRLGARRQGRRRPSQTPDGRARRGRVIGSAGDGGRRAASSHEENEDDGFHRARPQRQQHTRHRTPMLLQSGTVTRSGAGVTDQVTRDRSGHSRPPGGGVSRRAAAARPSSRLGSLPPVNAGCHHRRERTRRPPHPARAGPTARVLEHQSLARIFFDSAASSSSNACCSLW